VGLRPDATLDVFLNHHSSIDRLIAQFDIRPINAIVRFSNVFPRLFLLPLLSLIAFCDPCRSPCFNRAAYRSRSCPVSHLFTADRSESAVVRELPEGVQDITFHSWLDSYAAEGYEHGYARGTRDLLALHPLLIEQYLAANPGQVSPAVRAGIRSFGRFVEQHVGRKLDDAGFIDGSGI
jgi:hypothetical protein